MVVWQMPCESSSPPGSQLSQKAQSNDWAFLLYANLVVSYSSRASLMRQIGREPIWTANGGSRRDEPQDGVSNVVHRQPKTGNSGRKLLCVTPVSRLELCDQTAGGSLGPLLRVAKRRDPGWVEQWPDKTARCLLTRTPRMGRAQKRPERF